MVRKLQGIVAGSLAGLAATTASLAGADSAAAYDPRGESRFASTCDFSHRAADDPIVFPGQPGAAHSHDFFGNRSTNASRASRRCSPAGPHAGASATRPPTGSRR